MLFLFLYFFILCGLISASLAIFSKNTIHSILYLILVFCNASGLLFLLNVEYLALVFLIVYVGAIAVLFLFVVMMLNVKLSTRHDVIGKYLPMSILLCLIFCLELRFAFGHYSFMQEEHVFVHSTYIDWLSFVDKITNIQALGQIMYTYYYIPFILSSFILLIAMIGSITLTLTESRLNNKSQQIFVQTNRVASTTTSLIKE